MAKKDFVNSKETQTVEQKTQDQFPVGIERKIKVLSIEDSVIFPGKKTVKYEVEGVTKFSPTLKNLILGCTRVLNSGRQFVKVTKTSNGSQFESANFDFAGLSEAEYKESCELEEDFSFSL